MYVLVYRKYISTYCHFTLIDDILRAVVDYSTAPEVDENDITSMHDHPRDWVATTIRVLQDHKPLPT